MNKSSRIAIVAKDKAEGDTFAGILRSIGFHNLQVFEGAKAAYEVCIREQFPFFVIHNELPDMTGLTLIQKLRATGNYGAEAHLLLIDELSDLILPILQEFNIKFVLPKPFHAEKIQKKFNSLFIEESNLTPFEKDYRAALSALASGMADMAREMAIQALKTHGHHEKLLLLLGEIELTSGKPEKARPFFVAALKHNPLSAAAAHKIAKTYLLEKDFAKAAEMLNQQMKLNPLNIELLLNAGLSNYEVGNFEVANKAMSSLHGLDSQNKQAGEVMASIAIKEGRIAEACDVLQDSHGQSELVQFLNNEGVKLSQNHDVPGAIKMYTKCLESVRNNPYIYAIYYNLGLAYSKIHQHELAVDCYRQALRVKPDFERAAQALARWDKTAKSA
ncbi:MAG TPA: tetratricopeptide repeat protein [Oligoflexus sp.]|uniref:tetratricopeptide repeat protein n=1 Tax=Oligoflexus sp. TaxID=1971216 RepID=UPI002D6A0FA2|nr:tetratricopeptide repeat protein [Oligoflexus sp.]HYX34603.1 tetratricopeptide repeat protein [Oligoflexus sp.]